MTTFERLAELPRTRLAMAVYVALRHLVFA